MSPTRAVVWDLGGVLIDWDPRHLYRKLFADEAQMERFLREVCTPEWNAEQDAGRPVAVAVSTLQAEHPQHAELIAAFYGRWPEMLGGAYEESVELLAALKGRAVPVYALSNWSAETFPVARQRFEFLNWFDGLLISGDVKLKKPSREIFLLMAERFGLVPCETLFIDDSPANIASAARCGFQTFAFTSAPELRRELERLGLLTP